MLKVFELRRLILPDDDILRDLVDDKQYRETSGDEGSEVVELPSSPRSYISPWVGVAYDTHIAHQWMCLFLCA